MAKDKDSFTPGTDDVQIDMGKIEPPVEPKKKSKYDTSNPYEKYKNYKDPVAARYRKKMLANFLISAAVITITIVAVIAYVTSQVSDYTISLARGSNDLSLCENAFFEENANSLLKGEALDSSYCLDASLLPSDAELDRDNDENNEATHNGFVKNQGSYVGYTFYMKNVSYSKTVVNYKYNIQITKNDAGTNDVKLDDVIRYRLYRNDVIFNDDGSISELQHHECTTYAKASKTTIYLKDSNGNLKTDAEGNLTNETTDSEVLYGTTREGKPGEVYCTNFSDEDYVAKDVKGTLSASGVVRFTIVVWIEGNDPECVNSIPDGAAIQFAFTLGIDESVTTEPENPEAEETIRKLNVAYKESHKQEIK